MIKANNKAALMLCLGLFALPAASNAEEEPEYVDVPPPPARVESDDDTEQLEPEVTIIQRDPVDPHQLANLSGVFGGNHVRTGKQIERAQCDVARRADRCGNKIESRGNRPVADLFRLGAGC